MTRDGKGGYIWYFLRKDNPGKVKKVSNKSLQAYIDTLNGKKPSGIKSYEQLTNACFCYHYVMYSERRVPGCEFNASKLCCPTCKGFKLYGICSHVCAVNHLLDKCDLDDALRELSKPRRKGGIRKGVRPELVRERTNKTSSDSSEDEPLINRKRKSIAMKKTGAAQAKEPKLTGLQLPS